MERIDEYIVRHKQNKEKASEFVEYLYFLMDKYGIDKNSELYQKANISRQYWHKIISNETNPSLETVLKLVFALKLTNHECKYLLKKAGYTLTSSSTYSLIIRYCIENKIYDLNKVNTYLEKYSYKPLE